MMPLESDTKCLICLEFDCAYNNYMHKEEEAGGAMKMTLKIKLIFSCLKNARTLEQQFGAQIQLEIYCHLEF